MTAKAGNLPDQERRAIAFKNIEKWDYSSISIYDRLSHIERQPIGVVHQLSRFVVT